jgi:hypothetical protein
VELRAYTAGDAQATSVIFLRAVRETARAHYSPEQVEAWAANYGDLDSWAATRAAAHTQLAIIDGHVAGFTDLDGHGYIDMLFVDPDLAPAPHERSPAAAGMEYLRSFLDFHAVRGPCCSWSRRLDREPLAGGVEEACDSAAFPCQPVVRRQRGVRLLAEDRHTTCFEQ